MNYEQWREELNHFLDKAHLKKSFLDAKALKFMNEGFGLDKLKEVVLTEDNTINEVTARIAITYTNLKFMIDNELISDETVLETLNALLELQIKCLNFLDFDKDKAEALALAQMKEAALRYMEEF